MDTVLDYKCPACGGKLEFDSASQQMKCPFCDTMVDVAAMQQRDEALNSAQSDTAEWEATAGGEWGAGETDGMKVYVCRSCGGEIVGDETTGATACPFCDNPVVMAGAFSGALKPDLVIPFKLDKKAAKEALFNHLKGKFLLPRVFKDQNHIDEIKGIYVPFWLFDAGVNANITYKATRVRHWSDSRFNYTETSYFDVFRSGGIAYDNVPVDGSSKMDDTLMESIEPFNILEAVPFQTAYLSGYLADKYDVNETESVARANERMKRSTEQEFQKTVTGFTSVTPEYSSIQLYNGKAKYALYPIWLLNTTWQNKKFTFAMNGQTGKFVGDLPMDKGKFFAVLGGVFAAATALVFGIQCLIGLL